MAKKRHGEEFYSDVKFRMWERRVAQGGQQKRAGKTSFEGGLVSRRGYRRIIPDHASEISGGDRVDFAKLWAPDLVAMARSVLRGRNAAVFELLARGVPRQQIAEQFGVPLARIYRIKYECVKKLRASKK